MEGRELTRFFQRRLRLSDRSIAEGRGGALQAAVGLSSAHPDFEALPLRRRQMRTRSVAGWHSQVRHALLPCKRCALAEV